MSKKLNIIGGVIFTIFFIFVLCMVYWRSQKDIQIKDQGVYCLATIKGSMVSKGNIAEFDYEYLYLGKVYLSERSVSDRFYENHKIGDTIVVKVLTSEANESIIMEEMAYESCLGKQPNNGWQKLPICN